MSAVVDTNILLHAVNRDSPENRAAREFLESVARPSSPVYLTEGIVYEFLRVATHPRVFPKPLTWRQAWSFLREILRSPAFQILTIGGEHWRVLEQTLRSLRHPSGNLFFDVRTAVLMKENGVRRIYTLDADFTRFAEVEVVEPFPVSQD